MKKTTIGEALTGHLVLNRASEAPQRREPALVDASQGAALLNVSVRKFHDLRAILPPPVVLSSRVVRWRTADLLQFVARLPATTDRPEPSQLAAARTNRRASLGNGAFAADKAPLPTQSKATRGGRQRAVQSNSEAGDEAVPGPGIAGTTS